MPLLLILTLAATVVALGSVVWSGFARRRHLHYTLVVVMLACLTAAIYQAGLHGRSLIFEGTAATLFTWHFRFVALTFVTVPVVVFTGVKLARAADSQAVARRKLHGKVALAFVIFTVITFGLGLGMTLLASPAPGV